MEIVMENPITLAWMGDAVYSLKVREHLLEKGLSNPSVLQKENARLCSAAGQAEVLKRIEEGLTEDEAEIVRRGKNAHVRSMPKNSDLKTYRMATALEALFGYLFLYDKKERMEQLLDACMKEGDSL